MSAVEVAWVAGLLEGEGTFWTKTRTRGDARYRYPVVGMTMTDEDVIRRLHEVTGAGNVHGPFKPPEHDGYKRKARWQWQVTAADDAVALMAAIREHMGKRRGEAIDLALSAWKGKKPTTGRDWKPESLEKLSASMKQSEAHRAYVQRRWGTA